MTKKVIFTKHFLVCSFLLFGIISCATKPTYQVDTEVSSSIPVGVDIAEDDELLKVIEPYREQLEVTMNEVIGISEKELLKGKVESPLGNFVADAILKRSRLVSEHEIDIAAITIGGLRSPLPQGEIFLKHMYELMPFENSVYILELSGQQTRKLFEFLLENKNIAIANSMVILKDGSLEQIFIAGKPLEANGTYLLAISDYLAGGGDHMSFLEEGKILEKLPMKVRDLLIEEVKDQNAAGLKINANIEGRVRIL